MIEVIYVNKYKSIVDIEMKEEINLNDYKLGEFIDIKDKKYSIMSVIVDEYPEFEIVVYIVQVAEVMESGDKLI